MPKRPPIIRKARPKRSTSERLSPHRRGYTAQWQKIRKRIFLRDLGKCRECGRVLGRPGEAHIDHIIPKAAGGKDHDANLQLLCDSCHGRKTRQEEADGLLSRRRESATGSQDQGRGPANSKV